MNNEAYIALALEYIERGKEIKQIRSEYKKQFVKGDCIVIKKAESVDRIQIIFADTDDNIRCVVEFR